MNTLRWSDEQYAAFLALKKAGAKEPVKQEVKAKYRNIKTKIDGMVFDSKLEAGRYMALEAMLKAGEISLLRRQVPFRIEVAGVLVCKYVADFTYLGKAGDLVVEDAKGHSTDVYKLKKKLMRAVLGIEITEFLKEARCARKP